ncbi:MAG: DUF72 domain-containing protein [Lysobacteraceae bacterium]|nr:MAG: DUF72 domain-containing protein [Xanthomonadaceae bacterium]
MAKSTARAAKDRAGTVRVGVGGWTYEPWRGSFYPDSLVQRLELEYASRRLTTIEVNGTFYRAQKPATYAKWRGETPDGFVFSLKAPRYATDRRVLADAGPAVAAFVHGGLAELGDRLGPINWQLPEHKVFDADDLARFLDLLPADLDGEPLRHAIEVRHDSFACEAFVDLMRRRGAAIVHAHSPKYPSIADLTADFVYARLMRSEAGRTAGYAPAALDAWAACARAWARGGDPADLAHVTAAAAPQRARDVFVYFIGAAKVRNPAAAIALIERLREARN